MKMYSFPFVALELNYYAENERSRQNFKGGEYVLYEGSTTRV